MATTDEHVVQATLDGDEYEELQRLAERDGISVEEALERAIRGWVAQRRHVSPDDPIFEVRDGHGGSASESADARDLDAYVYGDGGDGEPQ